MALRTITSEPRATDSSPAAGRRTELAAFLRSRRERIRPDEVGLPPGGRRRTPGLRREEVAHLAGVGVTWYTWLEQGRDINVSTQVLDAISRTLRLDRLERNHLYTLAGVPIAPGAVECSVLTRPALRILEQLAPYPASVLNRRYDVLACNAACRKIFIDVDEIPVEDRNLLWLVFTVKQWNCSFLDHDDLHEALVAGFRANMAQHIGEPAWGDLVERLLDASPEFSAWSRRTCGSGRVPTSGWPSTSPPTTRPRPSCTSWSRADDGVRPHSPPAPPRFRSSGPCDPACRRSSVPCGNGPASPHPSSGWPVPARVTALGLCGPHQVVTLHFSRGLVCRVQPGRSARSRQRRPAGRRTGLVRRDR